MPICRTVFLAAGLVLALAARAPAADVPPVTIAVHAEAQGEILKIHGTVTAPDGAWVIYAAYCVAAPRTRARSYAQVKDGQFDSQVDISGWPAGTIKVDANFQMRLPDRRQPAAVIALYGSNGERISGDDVVQGGESFRAAVTSTTVTNP